MPIDIIPQEIIDQYNLTSIVHNGYVYMAIRKSMYGLKQAGILGNKLLKKRLEAHGYYPTKHTPGMWKHNVFPTMFSLVVDNFGIKYEKEEHAIHLLNSLKENYTVTEDWEGKLYCGITLKWNYDERTVELSMPGYIERALIRFQHTRPKKGITTASMEQDHLRKGRRVQTIIGQH